MGKRSDFKRRFADKYMTTDPAPVRRLQPYLPRNVAFAEPCAGRGDLIHLMQFHGHKCVYASDLYPNRRHRGLSIEIEKRDVFSLDKRWRRGAGANMFISNPPWTRETMHAIMEHLPSLLPTWLLLDADWMHTQQAEMILDRCALIVSVGRVKWMEKSNQQGVDNCAWYFFPHRHHTGGPRFKGLV